MQEQTFSVHELAAESGVPPRTIRHYIQSALLAPALGATRGAYYTNDHLNRLIAIRFFLSQGYSIKRVRQLIEAGRLSLKENAAVMQDTSYTLRAHIRLDDSAVLVVEDGGPWRTEESKAVLAKAVHEVYRRVLANQRSKASGGGNGSF